jgi:hypothetical protein
MDSDTKRLALATLDVMAGTTPDLELADEMGDHQAAATGAAYLAGFVVEMLSIHRDEEVSETIRMVRAAIARNGENGGSGVREPRRPMPSSGGSAATASGD